MVAEKPSEGASGTDAAAVAWRPQSGAGSPSDAGARGSHSRQAAV